MEPATVPPRNPSLVAVASSWMLPLAAAEAFTECRIGPTSTPSSRVTMLSVAASVMGGASVE
jgi:hypothetical protein